jgi:hypothetical protein
MPQAPDLPLAEQELATWSVRGEPRTREQFGFPHAGDFIGTGQTPREYPG